MKKNLFLISSAILLSFTVLIHFSLNVAHADNTDVAVDQLISLILSGGSASSGNIIDSGTVVTTGTIVTTGTVVTTGTTPIPEITTTGITTSALLDTFLTDQEFVSALSWLYTNGLTQFPTINQYAPISGLTRQQAAKFFAVFAQKIIGRQLPTTTLCVFLDTGFDSTLKPHVLDACALGIMYGKDGIFRPNDQVSRAEFTAALVRMVLGKKLDESTNPWRLAYYTQARDWGLTKEQNANAFDGKLSRYAAALLLYRSVGKVNSGSAQVVPSEITGNVTTGTIILTGTSTSGSAITSGLIADVPLVSSLTSDPALQEAVYRLHDIGVTMYTDINDFRPFDFIKRQEAAKMFITFRYAIGSQIVSPNSATGDCQFSDLENADQTLVAYINQACTIGILKGANGIYQPFDDLTRAQAISILLRITDGYQDESGSIWWQKYYDRALQLGMISPSSPENFEKPISRYEVAVLLYKSKIQKDILSNLNNNFEKNKFIFAISPMGTAATTGNLTGLVSINTYLLESDPNGTYVVDLFGKQYKILKTVTQKYLENDYVRYGKMLLLDETREIGTVALTLSDGIIISGIMRPYVVETATYMISPSSQQPYYMLNRIE